MSLLLLIIIIHFRSHEVRRQFSKIAKRHSSSTILNRQTAVVAFGFCDKFDPEQTPSIVVCDELMDEMQTVLPPFRVPPCKSGGGCGVIISKGPPLQWSGVK